MEKSVWKFIAFTHHAYQVFTRSFDLSSRCWLICPSFILAIYHMLLSRKKNSQKIEQMQNPTTVRLSER